MIEIIEGHDCSSYFWIMPVKFNYKDYQKYSDYWDAVEKLKEKEISIEESDVENFLYYFLKKYFDEKFEPNQKRDEIRNQQGEGIEGYPMFEWYLEHNFYSFESIEEMLKDIENKILLIKNDYNNNDLSELKNGFSWLAYLETDTKEKSKEELNRYAEEHKETIINFYNKFIEYMKDMIKEGKEKGYDLISIMGP